MRCSRLLLLPSIASLPLLFAGALFQQNADLAQATAPAPVFPVHADPGATHTLDQAILAYDGERAHWIKTQLWQKVHVPQLSFEAEGTYLGGPEHRLRLDLQVRLDATVSHFQLISDGHTLWQVEQVASGGRIVSRVELKQVLAALSHPQAVAQARDEFYSNQFFVGLAPLLRSLRQQVTFARSDKVRWRTQEVVLLTGVWAVPPADQTWPDCFPRQCRLFLDGQSLWPHRLEWWGPIPGRSGDSLVSQMEFRNPVVGQPLPEKEFAFQPGKAQVADLTGRWTQMLKQPKVE